MNKASDQQLLAAALDWYHLAGVDVPPFEPPTSRNKAPLQAGPKTHATVDPAHNRPGNPPYTKQSPPKQTTANHALAAASPAEAVLEARQLSQSAKSIEELHTAVAQFEGCSLKRLAKNLCFGDGNPKSSLMLVGEAPGRDEDLAGIPFVGRAGQLLDKMLQATELSREKDVWITNSVYWRPPGNRTPSKQETEICRPFLERQIELIAPKIIVALGGAAAKHLLDTTSGIMRLRGKWHKIEIAGQSYEVFPTLHPAYLLRTPSAKRLAWRDLLTIREKIEQNALQNS